MARLPLSSTLPVAIAFLVAACGLKGGSSVPDDPVPAGTIIASGEFSEQNGQTVSGTAAVYRLTSNGDHVVRLEGISFPSGSTILIAKANSAIVLQTTLISNKGSQNYDTGITDSRTWNSVVIQNSAGEEYGTALLR